jgi:fumarate reductase subunit D
MRTQPRNAAYRRDPLWLAALVHRLSGLALACFLPLHFLALSLALTSETSLDRFLRWTDRPLVKLAEAVLVGLLAVHLLGGLRVLVVENLPWHRWQKEAAVGVLAVGTAVAAAFLLRLF